MGGEVEERGEGDTGTSSPRSDKEIARNPLPATGLRRDPPVFGVAPPRRCPRIDSSSRLQSRGHAFATSIIVFMEVSTKSSPPIAVIEESADNIYSVRFILQSLGYSARSFSAAKLIWPDLIQFAPHVVILDMMIPAGGAYPVIRRIREGPLGDTPILAITADAMVGSETDIYTSGAQDVLSKPYSVTDLQNKLRKWIS